MMTHRTTPVCAAATRFRTVLAMIALGIGAAACKSKEPAAAPAAPATDSTILARRGDDCPNDGLWRPCVLLERLKRSGYDSKLVDTDTTRLPFLDPPGLHYQIGKSGLLIVFYYPDAESARKNWVALDTISLRPTGEAASLTPVDSTNAWPGRPSAIRSGNMIAAFFGTTAAQIERVGLALRAGLPQPPVP